MILGKTGWAIIAFVGYSLYGLFECIKQYRQERKLRCEFENVPEYIQDITVCHITKRHPRLKKREEIAVKKAIAQGDYQAKQFWLTEKITVPPTGADDGNSYFLAFDNGAKYRVSNLLYGKVSVGDTLWVVTVGDSEMNVIACAEGYVNLFAH